MMGCMNIKRYASIPKAEVFAYELEYKLLVERLENEYELFSSRIKAEVEEKILAMERKEVAAMSMADEIVRNKYRCLEKSSEVLTAMLNEREDAIRSVRQYFNEERGKLAEQWAGIPFYEWVSQTDEMIELVNKYRAKWRGRY